jgi:hypothetical protein
MLGRDDPGVRGGAFAVSVAISFTPLIGFLDDGLALAILRLNKVDVFRGRSSSTLTLGPTTSSRSGSGAPSSSQSTRRAHPRSATLHAGFLGRQVRP